MTLPLVVIRDALLLDEVLRLAAAAGSEVEVVPDAVAVRSRWDTAPLVIVGAELLGQCVRAGLPRRARVILVDRSDPSPQVWEQTVALGAEQAVVLPAGEATLIEWLGRGSDQGVGRGRVLCCIGGRGGAGASVLAAALAVTASRVAPAFLIDLDPCSGGLDLALGGEETGGIRWPDLGRTSGRLSAQSLREALPSLGGAAVLATARGDAEEIDPGSAQSVIESVSAAGDTAIIDLPRQLTAAARSAVALADRVLLVVPAEVRACVAASMVAGRLSALTDRTELVVRSSSGSRLPPPVIASTLGLPLAGSMRTATGVTAALDRGEFPARKIRGSLGALCQSLLTAVPARAAA